MSCVLSFFFWTLQKCLINSQDLECLDVQKIRLDVSCCLDLHIKLWRTKIIREVHCLFILPYFTPPPPPKKRQKWQKTPFPHQFFEFRVKVFEWTWSLLINKGISQHFFPRIFLGEFFSDLNSNSLMRMSRIWLLYMKKENFLSYISKGLSK